MFLEFLFGYWAFKPAIEEIDRYSYEHEVMQREIEELKDEIKKQKTNKQ